MAMQFVEALSIVYTLAEASRATAETGKYVNEDDLNEAFQIVNDRLTSMQRLKQHKDKKERT